MPYRSDDIPTPKDHTAPLLPIAISERIDAMDILRGLALVGILLMNIEWFNRAITSLGSQDTSLTGLDHAVGWLIRCFVEGKFYTLFALLFGMGFAVMLLRAQQAGRPFTAWFLRRMTVLITFGILHMVFLWSGDILHSYGFAGLLLLVWVNLLKHKRLQQYNNPRSFFKLALVWLCVPLATAVLSDIDFALSHDTEDLMQQWQQEIQVAERVVAINLSNDFLDGTADAEQFPEQAEQDEIELQAQTIVAEQQALNTEQLAEISAFTQNSYWQATHYRFNFALDMVLLSVPFAFLMLMPIFLFGYWLVSSGIMKNYRHYRDIFKVIAWVGLGLGTVLETGGLLVAQHPVANQVTLLLVVGEELFYLGQLVMSAGYFGLVMFLLADEKWHKRLAIFSPMGRMALTNYIMQSLILSSIFYGYAGGYFGEIARAAQMLIVLVIVIAQLLLSRWWLKYYAFGPLEWLWRCLSYKKLQTMRIQ